jgi:hypothetical protein
MQMSSVSFCGDSGDDPEKAAKGMRDMFGPQAFDNAIRQAISLCWMMLPDDKKNVAAVESEVRWVVERALKNLKDDASVFAIPEK